MKKILKQYENMFNMSCRMLQNIDIYTEHILVGQSKDYTKHVITLNLQLYRFRYILYLFVLLLQVPFSFNQFSG